MWAGKSLQSIGKENMSLEVRRKAEKVTKFIGGGDGMCVRSVQKCGFLGGANKEKRTKIHLKSIYKIAIAINF
jgi:hypothetical protein